MTGYTKIDKPEMNSRQQNHRKSDKMPNNAKKYPHVSPTQNNMLDHQLVVIKIQFQFSRSWTLPCCSETH